MTLRLAFAASVAMAALGTPAWAQASHSAQHVVRFEVRPIARVALSGESVIRVEPGIETGTPLNGGRSHTLSLTTNQSETRILASLTGAMPTGASLSMRVDPSLGGSSGQMVRLSSAPVSVATGIRPGAVSGIPVAFQVDGHVEQAAAVGVTVTVVAGS